MKTIVIIGFGLALFSIAFAQDMPAMKMPISKRENKQPAARVIYTCVMDPEVQMIKPGNCPKCGMKLIPKKIKTSLVEPVPQNNGMPVQMDTSAKKEDNKMSMKVELPHDEKMKMDENSQQKNNEIENPKIFLKEGKTVIYHLYVTDTIVNFTGRSRHAYAINGSIPAPILVFTEGDTAEIYLHNMLKSEQTSLHWHGVILPNQADGVPYLTTAPIEPGGVHQYKFPIVQNGTYWYHSHTQLQEQAGMYGALIFKKKEILDSAVGSAQANMEYTVVLSEWTDEKPSEVQRRLRTANDWYAVKKGSTQSYSEAIKAGFFKTKLANEWKRMKAMDVSDVYYDRFLLNGKPVLAVPQFKAGNRVKLRIVNGGASSYFWVQYGGGRLTVVANDGNDVVPVEVDRLIIGVAETYDVIVTIPENMSYEFRATPEDRTKSASLWLGSGMKMPAPVLPKLKYFEGMKMMNDMMKMNGDMKMIEGMEMRNQTMDMNTVMYGEITGNYESKGNKITGVKSMESDSIKGMKDENMSQMEMNEAEKDSVHGVKMDHLKTVNMEGMNMSYNPDLITLNYGMLRSPVKTTLPDAQYKELDFTLTGNMNHYVWSINNRTVNEWDKILIEKGQNIRIILFNNSMMRHPMHLHGHDFRVLNGQGEYAPLKNVLDIMPMERDTIEFAANKSGNWFFHCHILYHMMAGMGNVFSYLNSPINPELPDPEKAYMDFKKDNHMFHLMAKVGFESNGSDGEIMVEGNRFTLQGMWHLGYVDHHGYEGELNLGRYLGGMQWLFPYIGFDYHNKNAHMAGKNLFGDDKYNLFGQLSNKNDRKTIVAGVQYTLPMLAIADARIDGNGKLRFQLSREDVPLSNRLRFGFMINTDKEYDAGIRYIITKWFSLSTHYDSDMGLGAGVTITY